MNQYSNQPFKCTDLPQFDALLSQADDFRSDEKLHLRHLCNDSARCMGLVARHHHMHREKDYDILLDYSRQRVTGETMEQLYDLADNVQLAQRIDFLQSGKDVNVTEHRPVLHPRLRLPADAKPYGRDEKSQFQAILDWRAKIENLSEAFRQGERKCVTGKPLRNTLVLGIGGFVLGPRCLAQALAHAPEAAEASKERKIRFVCNADPVDFKQQVQDLDPEETLAIVIGKNFTSTENILNARTVNQWFCQALCSEKVSEKDVIAAHMMGVTCNVVRCSQFGIPRENILVMPDWVIPRFSTFSASGLLPLSIHFSYPIMQEVMRGAHDMDQHFFNAPLRDNIPVILGLLDVWNSTFLGYSYRATFCYSQALSLFPLYVQDVSMTSNAKRVAVDGTPLLHKSSEISFGGIGTNAESTYFQLMHQGRVVPADFIGFMESQTPVDLPGEAVSNHDELMSHFFAQPDALAYGKTMMDLVQEGVPERLRAHMVMTGNRPSSSLLLTRLDAFSIGQLMALYEHRVAVQGFLWGINSFDNYGSELGKALSKSVRSQLSASRKTGASVQGFNSSTSSLLEFYLAQGRTSEQK